MSKLVSSNVIFQFGSGGVEKGKHSFRHSLNEFQSLLSPPSKGSSSLSAIRVVSSVYLRLIFLLTIFFFFSFKTNLYFELVMYIEGIEFEKYKKINTPKSKSPFHYLPQISLSF